MLLTLDMETFFDADYTLKKLSTSEYIRDARFEVISCSVKEDGGPTKCYLGNAEVRAYVDATDWSNVELLAHHTQFDGLILSHHFGAVPKTYRDTLAMSRATSSKAQSNKLGDVGARLGVAVQKLEMPDFVGKRLADLSPEERAAVAVYNDADVESCYQIYQAMLPTFPPAELDLIDITTRMFANPVLRLDAQRVEKELTREVAEKQRLVLATGVPAEVLASRPKFAEALRSLGVEPPMKRSKANGRPTLALAQTDAEYANLAYHPDVRVGALVAGRMATTSTIGTTRASRLLHAGQEPWRVPVYLNYWGAHTGRWSGGDALNFQNFPRGGELRKSLLAPEGCVLVVVDSAQIECRVLAWLADEKWLLDEFTREGGDPYCAFASKAYKRVVTKADKQERQVGKVVTLACGYSMGAFKLHQYLLQQGINLPAEVCDGLIQTYRRENQNIKALWDRCSRVVHDMYTGVPGKYKCLSWDKDSVHLPNGLDLHYTDVVSSVEDSYSYAPAAPAAPSRMLAGNTRQVERRLFFTDQQYTGGRGRTKIYGGLACENFVQALARIVVGEQMRMIARRYGVVMMSHDEVVYVACAEEADEALAYGMECFRAAPTWAPDIPLNAEGEYEVYYNK